MIIIEHTYTFCLRFQIPPSKLTTDNLLTFQVFSDSVILYRLSKDPGLTSKYLMNTISVKMTVKNVYQKLKIA